MTCREKLKEMFPHLSEVRIKDYILMQCPSYVDIDMPTPDYCAGANAGRCAKCWDREIPGTETTKEDTMAISGNVEISMIKDSGDRTEFATGAVRDMREGKGRCDLMPLEVVAEITMNPIIECIAGFQNTGKIQCLYNALWLFADRAYGDRSDENRTSTQNYATMLLEVAKHFEEGAKKYGENNWQKGIPVKCYIDSAVRHYLKWLRGDKDEPHDRAFVWNLMCCIWEVDYREKEDA